jgi:hypothetical protein
MKVHLGEEVMEYRMRPNQMDSMSGRTFGGHDALRLANLPCKHIGRIVY